MQENPYQLATDIYGIGFLTADRIAAKLGIEKDNPARLEAGLLYTLQNLSNEGHVFYPLGPLLTKSQEILEVDPELVSQALSRLAFRQEIMVEEPWDQEAAKSKSLSTLPAFIWPRPMPPNG